VTYEQAKERAKQLNEIEKKREERAKRVAIQERFKNDDSVECRFLPAILVQEFEAALKEDHNGNEDEFYRSKQMSHWRAVKALVRSIEVDPKEWEPNKAKIFNYFKKQEWSLSYVQKLIILMNRWGYFCARKHESFFQPLSFPKSKYRDRIETAYEESDKTTKESKPLKEKHLQELEGQLSKAQFNWVYVSFWLGLRPLEVDNLRTKQGRLWDVEEQHGLKVLKVYQTKLVGIEKKKRWKLIPCLYPEQERALELVIGQDLKRPLVKTLERYLGEGYKTYAGRKGFESLLRSRGVKFEAISSYMGHIDVNRTWNSYRDSSEVILPDGFKKSTPTEIEVLGKRRKRSA